MKTMIYRAFFKESKMWFMFYAIIILDKRDYIYTFVLNIHLIRETESHILKLGKF